MMEIRKRYDNFTLIYYNPSPLEKLENMGRAMRIREGLEKEREERGKRPLNAEQKKRMRKIVQDLEDMYGDSLDNISYK